MQVIRIFKMRYLLPICAISLGLLGPVQSIADSSCSIVSMTQAGDNWFGVGRNKSTPAPCVAKSSDDKKTWVDIAVNNGPTSGTLNSIACTGNGNGVFCAAVGQDLDTRHPLIIGTTNGGTVWRGVYAYGILAVEGAFAKITCAGSGSNTTCNAIGTDDTNQRFCARTTHENSWVMIPCILPKLGMPAKPLKVKPKLRVPAKAKQPTLRGASQDYF